MVSRGQVLPFQSQYNRGIGAKNVGSGVTVLTRSITAVNGGDGKLRSYDPGGAFFGATKTTNTNAAVVTCQTAQNLTPTINSPTSVTFTSTQTGQWMVCSNVPGHTTTESADGLTFTITYTPTRKHGIFVSAGCINRGNITNGFPASGFAHCLQAPGARGVVTCGTGGSYASLAAAFAYVKSLTPSNGYCIVVKNDTYTADDHFIYLDGFSATQLHQPPSGDWTSYSDGTDTQFTIDRYTSVMAQSPFGVILDGLGTRANGIYLYGNTPIEHEEITNWPFGNNSYLGYPGSPLTGADRRGIYIAGFVVKNTTGGGWLTQFCDHIIWEYGMTIDSSVGQVDYNNSCEQFQNSKDCVAENMHVIGGGRYLHSTYQSKRIRKRRLFGRFSYLRTHEPHAFQTFYRGRQCRADNLLAVDSKLGEFNKSGSTVSYDNGLLAIAATGVHAYPLDTVYNKCLGHNNEFGGHIYNDAYEVAIADAPSIYFTDIENNWYKPDGRMSVAGITHYGPNNCTRFTAMWVDTTQINSGTVDGTYGYAFRTAGNESNYLDLVDSIVYKYGYLPNGSAVSNNYSGLYYAAGPAALTDCWVYDENTPRADYNVGGYITETRVNTTDDPTANGKRYPGRIEADSVLSLAAVGADNIWKATGPRCAFYGETGCDDDTDQNWVAEAMLPVVLPFYRDYDYTGTTQTLGTQTRDGEWGWAKAAKLGIDYVIGMDLDDGSGARDIQFPFDVQARAVSATVSRVSWRLFSSDYMTNVTGWKVYLDGEHAETCGQYDHSADFDGLISGRSYVATVRAVDSVFGESGDSYSVEFTA